LLIEKCLPELAAKQEEIDIHDVPESARIHELLREHKRFDEPIFIKVAAALGLDDHRCLTRRNRVTYRLESAAEKNVLMGLQRLILGSRFLPDHIQDGEADLRGYLYDLKDNWPYEFGREILDFRRLTNVCEALCPAGHCIKKGEKFYVPRPSTEEMLKRAKTRICRLHEAIDDMFDPDYQIDLYQSRKELGLLIEEFAEDLKNRQAAEPYDDEHYVDADIDWQIELYSRGDAVLYQEILALLPTCRHKNAFLVSQHQRHPQLSFDKDFALPVKEWQAKWNKYNTALVQQLAELLQRRRTTVDQLKHTTGQIVEHTILNIKSVDNALERHRKKTKSPVRYPKLTWSVGSDGSE